MNRVIVQLFVATVSVMVAFAAYAGGSKESSASTSNQTAGSGGDTVAAAKAAGLKYTQPVTEWTGPTSGPVAKPGKNIVYVSIDQKNPAPKEWGDAIVEAAKGIGWTVTVLDGKGSTVDQLQAMNQAIALKPDGIIAGAIQVDLFAQAYKTAREHNIPVVGIHATVDVGAYPDQGLFWNCAQSTQEIGKAEADFVIADSNGKGRAIVLTDRTYAIAAAKSDAEAAEFKTCQGCQLLEYANSPLAEVSSRIPPLVTSWIQKYGPPFYVMTIADYYYDFMAPALKADGSAQGDVKLVGADGTASAYERIRTGNSYQIATVPAPLELEGYQAVDELNRAMNGGPPNDWKLPVYVVTSKNLGAEGGDQNLFAPSNNYKAHYQSIWTTGKS